VRDRRYLCALLCLFLTGFISLYLTLRTKASDPTLPRVIPDRVLDWEGAPFRTVLPGDLRPGDYILREFKKKGGRVIKVMMVFSPTENYHPPALCYRGVGLKMFSLPHMLSSSGKIRLAGLGAYDGNEFISVYHGFYLDGQIMPDGVGKKVYEVKERLVQGRVRQYFFEMMQVAAKGEEGLARQELASLLDSLEPYLLDVR